MSTLHPTKLALIRTAEALLTEVGEGGFTVDDVLSTSNISRGSLYHHFHDFDDLIDSALIMRFSQYVDEDIASLASAIAGCETTDSFLERIEILAREIHSPNRRDRRAARIAALARATTSARMREQLSLVQARMTDSFADLFRELQERGIVSRDFAPKMYATFIQAYSIGKVIDDVTADHVDPEEWTRFVMKMISDWATEGARA